MQSFWNGLKRWKIKNDTSVKQKITIKEFGKFTILLYKQLFNLNKRAKIETNQRKDLAANQRCLSRPIQNGILSVNAVNICDEYGIDIWKKQFAYYSDE